MTTRQIENISIRIATGKDMESLRDISLQMRQSKDPDYFEIQHEHQRSGMRAILIAAHEGMDAGYCIMNWDPKYGYFRVHNIPEIQDLNVIPEKRGKGIGTALILHCEEMARKRGKMEMGISFGLHPGFGAAQRLYVKLGYVPDGYGVTYDRKIVAEGEFKPVDDQLCLMMTKRL